MAHGPMPEPREFVPNLEAKREQSLRIEVSESRNDLSMRNMVALINLLIDDVRKQNDRAQIKSIIRNQGKIAAFQELLDIIMKDYPLQKKV